MSYVNALQGTSTVDVNNQVDKMTHSAAVSQRLSLDTLVQAGPCDRDGEYVWLIRPSPQQADLAPVIPECLPFQLRPALTYHPACHHPPGGPASHLPVGWLYWTPFIMEGAAVFLTRINMHSA